MGERGHTIHVRDGNASDALLRLGDRIAIFGSNARWTSFIPMDAATFDGEEVSAALDRAILHVWFDDERGVVLQVYSASHFIGELSLPDDALSNADLDLLQKLEDLDLLTPLQRTALMDQISNADGCDQWTFAHGLEKLLDLPFYMPIPTDVPETEIRSMLPESTTIPMPQQRRGAKSRKQNRTATPSRTSSARKQSWNEKELATVALHCEYWQTVFSANNWKLYNRYKKQLPADQRLDVDDMLSAVFAGNEDGAKRLVQDILARIWDCEDWDALIRDPKLIDGDDGMWQEWLARLSRT